MNGMQILSNERKVQDERSFFLRLLLNDKKIYSRCRLCTRTLFLNQLMMTKLRKCETSSIF